MDEAELSQEYDRWFPLLWCDDEERAAEARSKIIAINSKIERIWIKEDKQNRVDPYMRGVFRAIYLDWKKKQKKRDEQIGLDLNE